MNHRTSVRLAVSIAALLAAGTSLPNPLPRGDAHQLGQGATRKVIVILLDQLAAVPGERGSHEARTAAIVGAQHDVLAHLHQAGARNVHSFRMINAVAATVTRAEAAALAA